MTLKKFIDFIEFVETLHATSVQFVEFIKNKLVQKQGKIKFFFSNVICLKYIFKFVSLKDFKLKSV